MGVPVAVSVRVAVGVSVPVTVGVRVVLPVPVRCFLGVLDEGRMADFVVVSVRAVGCVAVLVCGGARCRLVFVSTSRSVPMPVPVRYGRRGLALFIRAMYVPAIDRLDVAVPLVADRVAQFLVAA